MATMTDEDRRRRSAGRLAEFSRPDYRGGVASGIPATAIGADAAIPMPQFQRTAPPGGLSSPEARAASLARPATIIDAPGPVTAGASPTGSPAYRLGADVRASVPLLGRSIGAVNDLASAPGKMVARTAADVARGLFGVSGGGGNGAAPAAVGAVSGGGGGGVMPAAPAPVSPVKPAVAPDQFAGPPINLRGGYGAPAPAIPSANATSVSGRDLGYGQTINGVRVFSDFARGGIPQTMSGSDIAALQNNGAVSYVPSDAAASGAAGIPLGSPEYTAAANRVPAERAASFQRPTYDPNADVANAARLRDSRLSEIQDPRSAAGSIYAELRKDTTRTGKTLAAQFLHEHINQGSQDFAGRLGLTGEQLRQAGDTSRLGERLGVDVSEGALNRAERTSLAEQEARNRGQVVADSEGNQYFLRGGATSLIKDEKGQPLKSTKNTESQNNFLKIYQEKLKLGQYDPLQAPSEEEHALARQLSGLAEAAASKSVPEGYTRVGSTPDGKPVYKDKNGKQVVGG